MFDEQHKDFLKHSCTWLYSERQPRINFICGINAEHTEIPTAGILNISFGTSDFLCTKKSCMPLGKIQKAVLFCLKLLVCLSFTCNFNSGQYWPTLENSPILSHTGMGVPPFTLLLSSDSCCLCYIPQYHQRVCARYHTCGYLILLWEAVVQFSLPKLTWESQQSTARWAGILIYQG